MSPVENKQKILTWLTILFFILSGCCVAFFFLFSERWIYIACGFAAFAVRVVMGVYRRRINNQ